MVDSELKHEFGPREVPEAKELLGSNIGFQSKWYFNHTLAVIYVWKVLGEY